VKLHATLYPFQQEAADFAVDAGSALIWSAPGSGKTLVALEWALSDLPSGSTLVVVTRGGARLQWASETRRFTDLDPFVWRPPSAVRKKDEPITNYVRRMRKEGKPRCLVVGWEQLTEILGELLILKPSAVVWDEIHKGKAPKRKSWHTAEDGTLRSEELHNMSACAYKLACATPRRLGTTATPVMDRLSDLWGQFTLIQPHSWGLTATNFLKRYCGATPGLYGGWEIGKPTNVDELKRRMSSFVHMIPYSVSHAQLPKKRRMFTVVPLEFQNRVSGLGELKKEMGSLAKAMKRGSVSQAVTDRITEIKIWMACAAKRNFIVERAMETLQSDIPRRKVIVFTGRIVDVEETAAAMRKALAKAKLDVPVWEGHGAKSMEERFEIQTAYMACTAGVLVATYQSFGESLNLQDTTHCLVPLIPHRPGDVDQLEGRMYRLGMQQTALIEYPIAEGSIDERLRQIILEKLPSVDALNNDTALAGLTDTLRDTATLEARMAALTERIATWDLSALPEDLDLTYEEEEAS